MNELEEPVRLMLVAVVVLLSACTSLPREEARLARGHIVVPDLPVSIFAGDGGSASYLEMLDACARADVVIVGETHGHEVGLALAADLFEDLLQSSERAALSMEFYERDQQVALDDYLKGVTDREQFEKAAGRREGNDPSGHRRMIEAAREAGVSVIAANAPRRYVSLARQEGYGRLRMLTAEQQRLFVIPWRMPEGRYREDFFDLMGGMFADGSHGESDVPVEERVEAIFRSQSLWDATMADSIASVLGAHRPIVHVVGRFHSDFGGGTVQLLRDLAPRAEIVTISMIDSGDEAVASLREEDIGRADFVVYAQSPQDDEHAEEAADQEEAEAGQMSRVTSSTELPAGSRR